MNRHRNSTLIHYDPVWEGKALCGMRYTRLAPISLTSDKTVVTCGACTREMWRALPPMRCRVCGGEGEHDWEVHNAELRANELGY